MPINSKIQDVLDFCDSCKTREKDYNSNYYCAVCLRENELPHPKTIEDFLSFLQSVGYEVHNQSHD